MLSPPKISSFKATSKGRWLALWGAVALSCIYDPQDRCGPNMVLSEVESCDCAPGYVPQGATCIACPAHESESKGSCICDAGYQRLGAAVPCTEIPPDGLGAACSDGAPCAGGDFGFCAEASNGDRYCTRAGCTSSTECDSGFACATTPSGSFCRRSPLGMTNPCGSDADCAGTEATYCETLISQTCLVQGCSLSTNDCFEGWECCDVSSYGMSTPICVPEGKCPT